MDDEYEDIEEYQGFTEMSDKHFKSVFTLDVKKSILAYLPNVLGTLVLLYYVHVMAEIITGFQTPELQFLSLLMLVFTVPTMFRRCMDYKLVWKPREEYTTTLEGNNKVRTMK